MLAIQAHDKPEADLTISLWRLKRPGKRIKARLTHCHIATQIKSSENSKTEGVHSFPLAGYMQEHNAVACCGYLVSNNI